MPNLLWNWKERWGKTSDEKRPRNLPFTFAELWQSTLLKVTDEFTAPPMILQVGDSIKEVTRLDGCLMDSN
jgi:hypothetical protein